MDIKELIRIMLIIGIGILVIFIVESLNPMRSILALILIYWCYACILITEEMEFLACIYILVNVGAIAVLFLFIVMMINIQIVLIKDSLTRYKPYIIFIILGVLGIIYLVLITNKLNIINNTFELLELNWLYLTTDKNQFNNLSVFFGPDPERDTVVDAPLRELFQDHMLLYTNYFNEKIEIWNPYTFIWEVEYILTKSNSFYTNLDYTVIYEYCNTAIDKLMENTEFYKNSCSGTLKTYIKEKNVNYLDYYGTFIHTMEIKNIGSNLLYGTFLLWIIMACMILFVAMIGVIEITTILRKNRINGKSQNIFNQIMFSVSTIKGIKLKN